MTATTRYVNGVFKGGGAKGVAYAGALAALEEEHIWFKSVAGASAGAITAALIAAGYHSDEIKMAVPDGLKAAGKGKLRRLGLAVLGEARSVFADTYLREWLDGLLRAKTHKREEDGPVTFAELHAASGIDLYVVVMDLATVQPVVFNRRTTPNVEVAGAVASSSAIPGAFPAGRGVFSAADGAVIHQFVDGGSWANYPAFVFEDPSFRAWIRDLADDDPHFDATSWAEEDARPVMGFILGNPVALERRKPIGMLPLRDRVSRRFDRGPSYTSGKRVSFMFGWLLSSDWARAAIVAALAIWVTMSIVTLPVGLRRYASALERLPDAVYPFALVLSLTIVVLAAVVAIALIAGLVIAGRLLADTVLPTFSAIMAVPTDVTPWIGRGDKAMVLRVPHDGLETTKFNVKPEVAERAVAAAHRSVQEQLRSDPLRRKLATLGPVPPAVEPIVVAPAAAPPADADPTAPPDPPDRMSLVGLVIAAVAAFVAGGLGTWVANESGTEGLDRIGVLLGVGLVGVAAAFWYIVGRTGSLAARRAARGISDKDLRRSNAAALSLALGVAAVVGGLALSASAMHDRADRVTTGRVVTANEVGGRNDYVVRTATEDVSISTKRHLRLGERVSVRPSTRELAGALGGVPFGVAVGLVILGAGLLSSAVRWWSWGRRCRRLCRLVGTWTPATT